MKAELPFCDLLVICDTIFIYIELYLCCIKYHIAFKHGAFCISSAARLYSVL